MNSPAAAAQQFRGNDSALLGIVLSVLTFWLFAQTTLNVGPAMGEAVHTPPAIMNIAISLSALFSGMFIVVAGGIADKVGRVRFAITGNILSIVGSLLVGLAIVGGVGTAMLLVGRAVQGLSAACIMPSTMALLKTYWQGKERQRAVSLWSMGSWGGSGLASIFGGFMATTFLGWRSIFIISALISVVAIMLLRRIPEDAPARDTQSKLDYPGIVSLALFVLSLLIVVTQGSAIGWSNWIVWILLAMVVITLTIFIRVERGNPVALVDFSLFKNRVFTGAAVSNLLVNATAGLIPVSLWVIQKGAGWSAAQSGYLTIGYAVFILAFIRVGEKLLQRFGAKKPMIWGATIVSVAILMLMVTTVSTHTYVILTIIAYSLFGLGLAFYATPSTDAALSALPDEKAGAGSGVYKMASSLGAAFGAAIPTSIFVAMSTSGSHLGSLVEFSGRQDNLPVREAGMVALGSILIMSLIALSSILLFVPKSAGSRQSDVAPTKEEERVLSASEALEDAEHRLEEAKEETLRAQKQLARVESEARQAHEK